MDVQRVILYYYYGAMVWLGVKAYSMAEHYLTVVCDIPYHTLPHHTIPYLTIPYHAIS